MSTLQVISLYYYTLLYIIVERLILSTSKVFSPLESRAKDGEREDVLFLKQLFS